MNNIERIGKEVLYGLIEAFKMNIPYYVKDNFDYILIDEADIFLSDEDIIEHVNKVMSDDYTLKIIPVQREFISENEEDNFFYGDIELKLIKNV